MLNLSIGNPLLKSSKERNFLSIKVVKRSKKIQPIEPDFFKSLNHKSLDRDCNEPPAGIEPATY
jgi:hypothetical protein